MNIDKIEEAVLLFFPNLKVAGRNDRAIAFHISGDYYLHIGKVLEPDSEDLAVYIFNKKQTELPFSTTIDTQQNVRHLIDYIKIKLQLHEKYKK